MCELFAKVRSIMRDCAVPWTPARIRYVRLYCRLRHLERRTCARRCDVRMCVGLILEDWLNGRTDYPREPTRRFAYHLWLLEMDWLTHPHAVASP